MQHNNSVKIKREAIEKANRQFNPALNQDVEELTHEPSDRTGYDYAGTEQELIINHE